MPPPKDTIFARKIMMGAIDMNMDEIETTLAPEGKLDLAEGQEHAETISTMLMAFPHMFPPATNQWTAGADLATRDRYVRVSGCVDEFHGILSTSRRGFQARLRREPQQTSGRIQTADCATTHGLQRLPRELHEKRVTAGLSGGSQVSSTQRNGQ